VVDFAQALARGNAHVEYIWHVGGMPWAVATSSTIISALSQAHRQTMFGSEAYNGAATYFADEVDIWPYLEVPGAQSVRIEDGFGEIDGGTWNAILADLPVKPTWPHGNRTIWGLEGIQSIANPRVDNTVKGAKVASIMGKADTTIKFTDDPGASLYHAINAASDASPFICWIGGEAIAFTSCVDNADGSYTATTTADLRHILNSKACYHAPNRSGNIGMPAERICEQPLNGIIGRPAYLWAFVLDEADAVLAGPVKYRHGKVGGDVKYDGEGHWSVQNLPWWKWIDTEIDTRVVRARMDDYVLSRPHADWGPGNDQSEPHMQFREYIYATNTWTNWLDVWLCVEGATVHYASCAELEDALIAEMNVVSAASGNGWTYIKTARGPVSYDLTISGAPSTPVADTEQDWYFISGHIPMMLNWGLGFGKNGTPHQWFRNESRKNKWVVWYKGSDYRYENSVTQHNYLYGQWGLMILGFSYTTLNTDAMIYTPAHFGERPLYMLQWWYQSDTLPGGWSELNWWQPTRQFPIPETVIDAVGTPAIWIDPAHDITSMAASSVVQMGAEDILIGEGEETTVCTLSNFLESSVGTGTATTNYIVAAVLPPDTGHPAVCAVPNYNETSPKRIFYPGEILWFSKICHNTDPWPIIQSFDVRASSLGDMYKAIFGETVAGCNVAEEIQADHIPDYQTVDWTTLDQLTGPEECTFSDAITFQLRYSGTLNLWAILLEELKFYGINPTWEWNKDTNQYWMRFRKAGSINATMAYLGGNRINEKTIVAGSKIQAESADSWQLNAIDLSMNWNPIDEMFQAQFRILEHSGYAPTGGKINRLTIEPRITQIPNLLTNTDVQATLIAWFSNHLDNMMYPRPSQRVDATLYQCVQIGCGTDCLVTCDNVHNPFSGEVGITDYPCVVTESTVDPSKGTAKYNYMLAARLEYGWAPSCLVTGSTWVAGTHTATVTTIGGSGQAYCGGGITTGWYDHWFFADYTFNSSMSEPQTESSTLFYATAVEYGSKTPQVITGIKVATVSKKNYTDALSDGNFMTLVDTTDAWNTGKDYYLIYDAHNSAVIAEAQKKYVFIASDGLVLSNSDATTELVREWT